MKKLIKLILLFLGVCCVLLIWEGYKGEDSISSSPTEIFAPSSSEVETIIPSTEAFNYESVLDGYEITYRTSYSRSSSSHELINFQDHTMTRLHIKKSGDNRKISGISSRRIEGDKENGWTDGSFTYKIQEDDKGHSLIYKYNKHDKQVDKTSYSTDVSYMVEYIKQGLKGKTTAEKREALLPPKDND